MKTQSVKTLERQHDKVHALDIPASDKVDTLEGIEGEMIVANENEQRLERITTLEGYDLSVIFTDKEILSQLMSEIDDAARSILWDVGTKEGRATGASIARKVSSSKVVADNAGKALTEDWAMKKKKVDEGRRVLREFCDKLRDDIKAPIDLWKEGVARLEAEEKLAEEIIVAWDDAHQRDDLYNREAAVRKVEDKIAADKLAEYQKAQEEALKEAGAERERQRASEVSRKLKLEEQARIANKEHRRLINNAAAEALVAAGLDIEMAKKVISVIAVGLIPAVVIHY